MPARAPDPADEIVTDHALVRWLERACGQHTGTCTNAISDGNYMLIAVEGRDGRIAARLVCEFNQFRDRRTCANFDTGQRYVEVFANGRWVDAR